MNIKEKDFDYLGLIKLNNSEKIEKLVSKINNKLYVSRSYEYYKKKTYNELVDFREELKQLFPLEIKKAFVVCEYMLNASYRVFYEDYKKALKNEKNNMDISKICMEEDVSNIIKCLRGEIIDSPSNSLKKYKKDLYAENRVIEGDHKMLLYKTISNIKDAKHIVCPLYSAILIGPFFKVLHNVDYSYVKFGIHDQNMKELYDKGKVNLKDITINKLPNNIEIFDGNVGTGGTLIILKDIFLKNNINVRTGSLEISYEYMERNKDFSILENIDYKTYISTRHHTIIDDLVETICNNYKNYLNKLKSYGYQNKSLSDIELLYNRGRNICRVNNISFDSIIKYNSSNIISIDIMNRKVIKNYTKIDITNLDKMYGTFISKKIKITDETLNLLSMNQKK